MMTSSTSRAFLASFASIASVAISAATLGALEGGCRAALGVDELEFTDVGGGDGVGGSDAGGSKEQCLDGIDNDGDGAIDCADVDDCDPSVECVDASPPGWTGYSRVRTMPYVEGNKAPPCPDGSAPVPLYFGPAGPAECTPCGCQLEGAACSAPDISFYFSSATCGGMPSFNVAAKNTACGNVLDPSGGASSCKITGPPIVTNPGVCATSGGELKDPVKWNIEVDACEAPAIGGGCSAGKVCAPKGSPDYPSGACVHSAEGAPCPEGWLAQQINAFEAAIDTRGCDACSCGAATCSTDGYYDVFDDTSCTAGGGFETVNSAACLDTSALLDLNTGSLLATLATVAAPVCAGGAPHGDVQGTGSQTICCRSAL